MSTLERKTLQPAQLINYKLLTSVVRDFFAASQLSQFMDQVNPLAELEHKRRISAMGPGGFNARARGFRSPRCASFLLWTHLSDCHSRRREHRSRELSGELHPRERFRFFGNALFQKSRMVWSPKTQFGSTRLTSRNTTSPRRM